MEKEYVVRLDVYLGVLEARVISFNQLNTGTCKLSFELTSNKQALDLTGQKVTFEVTTPGGATLEDAILITDATQGKCECTLANDMIAEQGMHYAEINVYSKDNTKLFTFNKFRYIVNGQLGAKDITVDTRYSTLQELIFDVENLKNQSVIDTETVTQMKNETDLMHKDVIVKHGEVEVKHQEVVTLAQSVKDDASRTASNAQQVSTDKGIVTKSKNEVVAKHDEVLRTAKEIAQDKTFVEQAKTEIVGYKNDVEAMKNDVQQLVTDSTEDLILEGNKQVTRISTEGTTQVNLAKAEVTKATQQATVATEQAGIAQRYAETAQGELSKVTAEGVKQVKAVATEGAKQIELAKTEVIKAEEAATLATTEADRAGAQAQEKVNSKIGHNGVFDDTIFNFIGDENSTISALQIGEKTYSFNGSSSGTTTDNVVDRAGRTQEQINRTFYKRMCKEIPSPGGESITVENGEEGYVLSAEIKGQTVKNYGILTDKYYSFNTWTLSTDYVRGLQVGKTYYMIVDIKTPTTDGYVHIRGLSNKYITDAASIANKSGINILSQTMHINATQSDLDDYINCRIMYYSNGIQCDAKVLAIVETLEEAQKIKSFLGFGLSSAQAIISNNGQSYPIYATEEDKANKKVILLGGVGDVQDTLEIKDDGSVVYTQNLKPVTFDGTENWSLIETRVNTLRFNFPSPQYGVALNTLGILDKIPFGNPRSGDIEGFSCLNNTFTIAIAKTKLVSEDVDGFKKWLSENNQSGLYPISTSIVTPIPKELVPTILTHNQTNILDVGGAVKPSSFKVTVPVDRLAEIEARLQALENTTVDVVLNK